MPDSRGSRMIPRTRGACALYLLVGILVAAGPIWRMVEAGEAAVLPVVAAVAGVLVVVTAVIGFVSPRLRGRK